MMLSYLTIRGGYSEYTERKEARHWLSLVSVDLRERRSEA